jgi:hypothetical protein
MEGLEGLEFDDDTRAMLGLDDIDEILGQIDEAAEMDVEELEQEAEAVKSGSGANIRSADEVIQEMDEEVPDGEVERAEEE